jgi:mono/diheme cytochrome c family protein
VSGTFPTGRAALLAGVALIVAAAAWYAIDGRTDTSVEPGDAGQIAAGARVYGQSCASCHGKALEGQPNWRQRTPDGRLPAPPHDATGHTWHHDDATLLAITKRGTAAVVGAGYRSDMPAFEGTLSDDEIRAVLAYIKSTWPAEVREKQAQIDRQAQGQNR